MWVLESEYLLFTETPTKPTHLKLLRDTRKSVVPQKGLLLRTSEREDLQEGSSSSVDYCGRSADNEYTEGVTELNRIEYPKPVGENLHLLRVIIEVKRLKL